MHEDEVVVAAGDVNVRMYSKELAGPKIIVVKTTKKISISPWALAAEVHEQVFEQSR